MTTYPPSTERNIALAALNLLVEGSEEKVLEKYPQLEDAFVIDAQEVDTTYSFLPEIIAQVMTTPIGVPMNPEIYLSLLRLQLAIWEKEGRLERLEDIIAGILDDAITLWLDHYTEDN